MVRGLKSPVLLTETPGPILTTSSLPLRLFAAQRTNSQLPRLACDALHSWDRFFHSHPVILHPVLVTSSLTPSLCFAPLRGGLLMCLHWLAGCFRPSLVKPWLLVQLFLLKLEDIFPSLNSDHHPSKDISCSHNALPGNVFLCLFALLFKYRVSQK